MRVASWHCRMWQVRLDGTADSRWENFDNNVAEPLHKAYKYLWLPLTTSPTACSTRQHTLTRSSLDVSKRKRPLQRLLRKLGKCEVLQRVRLLYELAARFRDTTHTHIECTWVLTHSSSHIACKIFYIFLPIKCKYERTDEKTFWQYAKNIRAFKLWCIDHWRRQPPDFPDEELARHSLLMAEVEGAQTDVSIFINLFTYIVVTYRHTYLDSRQGQSVA